MTGQISGKTRRLNRHYQSGKKGHTGQRYALVPNASRWAYFTNQNIPVGDFFDGSFCWNFIYDMMCVTNFSSFAPYIYSGKKVIESRPVIKMIIDFAKVPAFFSDKGLYLSIFRPDLSTYIAVSQKCGNNIFSYEGDENGFRPPVTSYTDTAHFSPQILSKDAISTITTYAVKMNFFGPLVGWKYTYMPVQGRGIKIESGKKVEIAIVQDYSAQDVENWEYVCSRLPSLYLLTDYLTPGITAGGEYTSEDLEELGIINGVDGNTIFNTAQRATLDTQKFDIYIDFKKCTIADIVDFNAHYPLTDFYNV